ncbi:MAG TPA: YdcF family protein [Terriglobales bacterium]|nr:YdcF family protein [Terriglobales bacterium]
MGTQPNNRRLRLHLLVVLVLVVVFASAVVLGRAIGCWLVREEALSSADVIVVLSGSIPYRAEEAAKIFVLGDAREIWVSRPESPATELEGMGIHFVGEEEYNCKILIKNGVPEIAIHIFPDPVVNTEQEVEEIAREMKRAGMTKVIIVTSPPHTRRVKALWNKLVGAKPETIVRAAFEDPYDADHWWRNTRDAFAVSRELLGLLNVWAGLPVRPHEMNTSGSGFGELRLTPCRF